jgi:hypothetical protein
MLIVRLQLKKEVIIDDCSSDCIGMPYVDILPKNTLSLC